MRKAINLLTNNCYEVETYKNVLYSKVSSNKVPYIILERTDKQKQDIEHGYLYTFYEISGVIYNSFFTNNYKCFAKEIEQMRLDI